MTDHSDQPTTLAELTQADLDPATLAALFSDLAACTTVHQIQSKSATSTHANDVAMDLASAQQALVNRQVRAVQIRYSWNGGHWLDTLLCLPSGVRLVRTALPA